MQNAGLWERADSRGFHHRDRWRRSDNAQVDTFAKLCVLTRPWLGFSVDVSFTKLFLCFLEGSLFPCAMATCLDWAMQIMCNDMNGEVMLWPDGP